MRPSCLGVILLLAGPIAAQEQPQLTAARQKIGNEWLLACMKAGAVQIEGTGAATVVRFDEKKVRAFLAGRRERINAELVDTLVALWFRVDERFKPLAVALLRGCAEEKKDERARGWAAYLTAAMDEKGLRLARAARGFQKAARHFEAARDPAWQAASVNNAGTALLARAEYDDALTHYRQALRLCQALYPRSRHEEGHPRLVSTLNNIGAVLHGQGDHEQALDYHRRALQMCQALFPESKYPQGHQLLAICLNSMGVVLQDQGDYEESLRYLRRALQMYRGLYPPRKYPQGHRQLAQTLTNLGTVLRDQGEHARALDHYLQALEMRRALFPEGKYPQGHPDLAQSLGRVANVLQAQGENDRALKYARQELQMCRGLFPEAKYPQGHPVLASSLNNLGAVLYQQGDHEQALKHFRLGLDMRRALFPPPRHGRGHPLVASSLSNVGLALKARGEYEEAQKHYREAARMQQSLFPPDKYPQGHRDLAGTLSNLGSVLEAQGKHGQALDTLREALRMQQHEVDRLASSAPEDRALNFAASLPLTRDTLLSLPGPGRGPAPVVYAAVWPTRSAITRVHERRQLALLAAAGSPRVKVLYDRLLSLRRQRARLLLAPLPRQARAREERLETLSRDIEKTEDALRPLLPALARSQRLACSTPEDLQKALPARTAFIDLLRYVHFDQDPRVKGKKGERRQSRYAAFVVRRDRLVRVDLGEAKAIEEALELWRRALTEDSAAAPRHGRRRWERTWKSLAGELQGIETVYLAPDARLTQLPWAALPGERPGTALLEQRALAVVPHGAFLLDRLTAPRVRAEGKPVLLAVGGVHYDDRPPEGLAKLDRAATPGVSQGLKWGYLPGTEKEVERIRSLAGPVTARALTGVEANSRRVLAELPRANLAHLATHGFFADAKFRSVLQLDEALFAQTTFRTGNVRQRIGAGARSPLVLSGLVLAGANRADTPDRGILSADDLTRLDLRKLDLAVLSACETGLGEVGGGEGVFGLQRAFHVAGTRNVVASLWKVDDQATAALMTLFYRFLWEQKMPPIEALRRAQLALYHNPRHVKEWSLGRGPNLKTVLPGGGKEPGKPPQARTAPARTWAAFVLSGPGD